VGVSQVISVSTICALLPCQLGGTGTHIVISYGASIPYATSARAVRPVPPNGDAPEEKTLAEKSNARTRHDAATHEITPSTQTACTWAGSGLPRALHIRGLL
jgi:hypothetical protein